MKIKKTAPFVTAAAMFLGFMTVLPNVSLTAAADENLLIDKTNFPDDTFRQYVKDKFDSDNDGSLSQAETASVLFIDVSGTSENPNTIADLKGIEHFENLRYLTCDYNQLTSLDVSNNTLLIGLLCDSNQLTSLNVSNNTLLTELSCHDNQLTSLDVNSNTALEVLYCYDNQLTSLDVSNNAALEVLYFYGNQLTSLDVSSNTALAFLDCSNNQLTSLDVSNNTALEYFECNYNTYNIGEVSGSYELANLPEGFNAEKASNWQGAEYGDGKLINITDSTVTYDYDCGNGETTEFTLICTLDIDK